MNIKTIAAYAVHLFTASGLILSFLSLLAVINGRFMEAFMYNGAAVLIDSFDGILARHADVKKYASQIDGALMDNIIDFITFTLMPALFFVYAPLMLSENIKIVTVSALLLSSIFQFSNTNAKTKDHFFLGFPSYWNVAALYLWVWQLPGSMNAIIIWLLAFLSFVPIKFIYPSRLDFFSNKVWLRQTFFVATIMWGIATFAMLVLYPNIPVWLNGYVIAYMLWYTLVSLQKTFSHRSKN